MLARYHTCARTAERLNDRFELGCLTALNKAKKDQMLSVRVRVCVCVGSHWRLEGTYKMVNDA